MQKRRLKAKAVVKKLVAKKAIERVVKAPKIRSRLGILLIRRAVKLASKRE